MFRCRMSYTFLICRALCVFILKDVLASGTAIGLVGEWENFAGYLKTSYNANQFGQPLVAAVMKACLLCGRYEEAFDAFDDLVRRQNLADEWQWRGGEDRLHPLCRDLAMRAIGGCRDVGLGSEALRLYHEIQKESSALITLEAIYGVLSACENEAKWEEAVDVLFSILNDYGDILSRIVRTDDELLSSYGIEKRSFSAAQYNGDYAGLELLLIPVMRTCNSAGQPGVSVLCQQLLAVSSLTKIVKMDEVEDCNSLVSSLVSLMRSPSATDELLNTSMTSLCEIGCYEKAKVLFEVCSTTLESQRSTAGRQLPKSRDLYNWILLENQKHDQDSVSHGWDSALSLTNQIATACCEIKMVVPNGH